MAIIIKLGGSLITHKHSGRPVLRLDIVRKLAHELVRLRRSGHLGQCIILHGASSFGHPLVFSHRLNDRRLSHRAIPMVSQTIQSVNSLTMLITKQLLSAGLPVIALQTTSLVTGNENQWKFLGQKVLQQILLSGGIPLLSGQMVVSDNGRSVVLSADKLAIILAELLPTTRIIFCTDVDGVYAHFPPYANELPIEHIDRYELGKFIRSQTIQKKSTDVTGAMIGKLQAIAALHHGTVIIVNGFRANRLVSACSSHPHGTVIEMEAKKKPSRKLVKAHKY